ncbi:hypothetical protein CspHIS471_0307430 [Cutaneotrichosporon sp. HIS471]|nr:hypothetical protein CspHIS471_0307430 [Cutaneotrichosporon sp. HIS471]
MRSLRPRHEFLYDPRLRTFARVLQALCIELEKPGALFWVTCEPIPSFHNLTNTYQDSREMLKDMYFRVRGVLRRRANTLVRVGERLDKGEEVARARTTLETQLWNARDCSIQALEAANARHVVSFLKSCAHDIVNEPLPPLPLPRPSARTDPAQVAILMHCYGSDYQSPSLHLLSSLAKDQFFQGLVSMEDSDDE